MASRMQTSEEIEEYLFDSESDEGDIYIPTSSEDSSLEDEADIGLPGTSAIAGYNWSEDAEFSPPSFPFQGNKSGIRVITDRHSELDIFELLFTEENICIITDETNRYFEQVSAKNLLSPNIQDSWKQTTTTELMIFFGLCMLMGSVKKNAIRDYWSSDPKISTPFFSDTMSRSRFELLLRMLHFVNNLTIDPANRLSKFGNILQNLKASWKSYFYPYENVCIDESLFLWKGRLSFKQYIPSKRSRFGIKLYILADCKTKFVLDIIVYTGKTTEIADTYKAFGHSGSVVLTLLEDYYGRNHKLYIDNYYTSPALIERLKIEGIQSCETVRQNRKNLPNDRKKLVRGEVSVFHTDSMLYERWVDRREVRMLTNFLPHKMETEASTSTSTSTTKPLTVLKYNGNMGAVDNLDTVLSYNQTPRKTVKWYKKLFFHFLDICTYNSYILYTDKHPNKYRHFSEFRLELIQQIVDKYTPSYDYCHTKSGRPSKYENPKRLKLEKHFLSLIPPTEKSKKPYRRCHVCGNSKINPRKRVQTRYECKKCDVALCVTPCMEIYHTKLVF
ncbi:piggyBac transposable element-derived protein 4-like [Centruroides vittatus]|uniref:piggyBac transposable element-derived protein 4-like n=1 Tax=Centruroides vittatus TaxID=120091 RepID=UPI00350F7D9E